MCWALQENIAASGQMICSHAGLDFLPRGILSAFNTTCLLWGQGFETYLCGKSSYFSVSCDLLHVNFAHLVQEHFHFKSGQKSLLVPQAEAEEPSAVMKYCPGVSINPSDLSTSPVPLVMFPL